MSLKIISISQYLKVPTTGSYEVDDGAFFPADFDSSRETTSSLPEIDTDNLTYGRPHLSQTEEKSFFYYCGHVTSRVLKVNVTCDRCSDVITTCSATSAVSAFTTEKCYTTGALVYPSDRVYSMLLTCEDCFVKWIVQCVDKENTLATLQNGSHCWCEHPRLPWCETLIRRFCHARLQLHLSELSWKSRIKLKDMGGKSMCAPRRQKWISVDCTIQPLCCECFSFLSVYAVYIDVYFFSLWQQNCC